MLFSSKISCLNKRFFQETPSGCTKYAPQSMIKNTRLNEGFRLNFEKGNNSSTPPFHEA